MTPGPQESLRARGPSSRHTSGPQPSTSTDGNDVASRGPSARRQRLSAPDWIDAALKVIAENGVEAVAVEPLAQRLGVTKGSFYAHFSSRNALGVAALEQWKSDETACTSALLVGDDPLDVLSTLFGSMFGDHQRGKVYAGICAAGADPLVTPYALDHALAKVQILTDLYGSVGLPKAVAAQRAELTYTAYMGHWRVKAMLPLAETGSTNSYIDHLIDTLIPS